MHLKFLNSLNFWILSKSINSSYHKYNYQKQKSRMSIKEKKTNKKAIITMIGILI